MPETWPPSLSKALKSGSFQKNPIDTRLFTSVGVGDPKVRATDTKKRFLVQGSIWVNSAEHDILENFVDVTLSLGTKSFTFPDGVTGANKEYRFMKDGLPAYTHAGGDEYNAQFTMIEV